MANFTQLDLGNKNSDPKKPQTASPLSREKTLFGAGLLALTVLSGVLFLITNGCSKGPAKIAPTSSSNQDVAPSQSPIPPAPVATALPSTPDRKPVHKRVQRKAPTTQYADPIHGISFRYPKNYILKTGDEPNRDLAGMGPLKLDFALPGGMTLAAVELPHNAYPGTDFSSAFFSVSVNPDLSGAQCEEFASPDADHPANDSANVTKAKIGETAFDVTQDISAGVNDPRTRYYHRFENGTCYEFAMGLATDDRTLAGLKPVNREQVFRKLEQILATVKLQPGVAPEVAKGNEDHPVVEGGKE